MRRVELLIQGASTPPSRGIVELRGWLMGRIAEFEPGDVSLYCARHDAASAEPEESSDEPWFLAVSGAAAKEPFRLRGLITEMRLLGLEPQTFRLAEQEPSGLAKVF